jgi:hypothetical protein
VCAPLPRSPSVASEEVAAADAALFEGGKHLALGAAGETAEEYAAVFGLADVEVGGVLVFVGGAEGPVLAAGVGAGGDCEYLQDAL